MAAIIDCLIIGGGPAGLTSAIYGSRFLLSVQVIDSGHSRAGLIPRTRNHAGYPGGIAGSDLLARMREQAVDCGGCVTDGQVLRLERRAGQFLAKTEADTYVAKAVILATGVTNRKPEMAADLHAAVLASGQLRYCPVCDGFEVTDKSVAVIGSGAHGIKEALFLRSFTRDVTLIAPAGQHDLTLSDLESLNSAAIKLIDGPVGDFHLEDDTLLFSAGGRQVCFDAIYPAMGSDIHSGLARMVGADLTDLGCIVVDEHQRSSVPGLYAAGDVVIGLDQISHAMGEAGVAATTLRNDLAAELPFRR